MGEVSSSTKGKILCDLTGFIVRFQLWILGFGIWGQCMINMRLGKYLGLFNEGFSCPNVAKMFGNDP